MTVTGYTKTAVDTQLATKADAQALTDGLATKVNSSTYTAGLATKADTASLATVATSGSYTDLTGKPTIPAAPGDIGAQPAGDYATNTALTTGLSGKQDTATLGAAVAADTTVRAAYVSYVAAPTGVAATDTAAITAAANAASAAGGGTVLLRPGTYKLNASLPVLAGVTYRGAPPVQTQAVTAPGAYLADAPPTFSGGTVLQGDGTFACFQANATDLASPSATFGATQIANFGLYGLGLDNFTYGLRIGAKNIMGLVWSTIDQLYIKNCSQWGLSLVNFIHLQVGVVETTLCQNGQYWGCQLDSLTYQGGNTIIGELYHLVPQDGRDRRLCRGIVFEAMGGTGSNAGVLNEIDVQRLEVNNYSVALLSVAATFTSGSTSVTVPDGTKFAAGQVVTFTGSNFGYTAGYGYVVKSVSGNTITLAAKRNGAAISASGSGTLTLQSYGFPPLEVTAGDANASHVSASRFAHLDIEGNVSASVYVENAQQCEFSLTMVPSTRLLDFVARGAQFSRFYSAPPAITDFDAASTTSNFSGNRQQGYQRMLRGQTYDQSQAANGLMIATGQQDVMVPDLQSRLGGLIYPAAGMGERIFPRGSNITLSAANCGDVVYTGASALTFTLPVIVLDSPGNVGGSTIGAVFDIYNCGSGTITVNTQSSQLINGIAGRTTYALTPGNRVKFVAAKDINDTLLWLGASSVLLA